MLSVAVFDAKTRLSELLVQVQQGEEFTITRHGVPMARLVAVGDDKRSEAGAQQKNCVDQAFATLANLRKDVTLDLPLRDAI